MRAVFKRAVFKLIATLAIFLPAAGAFGAGDSPAAPPPAAPPAAAGSAVGQGTKPAVPAANGAAAPAQSQKGAAPAAPGAKAGPGTEVVAGIWARDGHKEKLEFFDCGGKLCAKGIIPLPDGSPPPLVLRYASKTSRNQWKGDLFNPEDGKTYSGTITLEKPNQLTLSGCLIAFLCQSETWTRVPKPAQPPGATLAPGAAAAPPAHAPQPAQAPHKAVPAHAPAPARTAPESPAPAAEEEPPE